MSRFQVHHLHESTFITRPRDEAENIGGSGDPDLSAAGRLLTITNKAGVHMVTG